MHTNRLTELHTVYSSAQFLSGIHTLSSPQVTHSLVVTYLTAIVSTKRRFCALFERLWFQKPFGGDIAGGHPLWVSQMTENFFWAWK